MDEELKHLPIVGTPVVAEGTGIRTNIADYHLVTALSCPFDKTLRLADLATRLKRLGANDQEKLINWGYAVCDAAMRRHVDSTLPRPSQLSLSRSRCRVR
jgi:NTE family protein